MNMYPRPINERAEELTQSPKRCDGWAVRSGNILVSTVAATRRAAIVNYLVAQRQVPVYQWHTDSDIDAMWERYGKNSDCIRVSIVPYEGGRA